MLAATSLAGLKVPEKGTRPSAHHGAGHLAIRGKRRLQSPGDPRGSPSPCRCPGPGYTGLSIFRAQDKDPWRKHRGCCSAHEEEIEARTGTWHAAHTCGMPYWSMTCQIYQSSLRDDFLSRKVVTKAYSSGKPCGNTSLEGDKRRQAESGGCKGSPRTPGSLSLATLTLWISEVYLVTCLHCLFLPAGPPHNSF